MFLMKNYLPKMKVDLSLLDYANEHQRSMSAVSEYRQMALKVYEQNIFGERKRKTILFCELDV